MTPLRAQPRKKGGIEAGESFWKAEVGIILGTLEPPGMAHWEGPDGSDG